MLTREQHLFDEGPKRILALDGGGVRGLITLGVLKRLEDLLRPLSKDPPVFRLSDYFDLIAGTSTGSIIATALALGWSVDEVTGLYNGMCPVLFPRTGTKGYFRYRRSARKFAAILDDRIGGLTLGSDELKTGLLICAKRIDTDSAWVLTNSPRSKYWVSPNNEWFPNRDYELAMLVRASAAAPTFFRPVTIEINDASGPFPRQTGVFVDGAISGHNCPALQALLTATLPPYGIGWKTGKDNLLMISVGTGWRRERVVSRHFVGRAPWEQAITALKGMINDTVRNDLLMLQAISDPRLPWPINGEVGGLKDEMITDSPLISFQRYDVSLEDTDVIAALGLQTRGAGVQKGVLRQICEMDCGRKRNIENAFALGLVAGAKATMEDFPPAFDGDVIQRGAPSPGPSPEPAASPASAPESAPGGAPLGGAPGLGGALGGALGGGPGGEPGGGPSGEPGGEPGGAPGDEPGGEPESEAGSKPGSEPGGASGGGAG